MGFSRSNCAGRCFTDANKRDINSSYESGWYVSVYEKFLLSTYISEYHLCSSGLSARTVPIFDTVQAITPAKKDTDDVKRRFQLEQEGER